MTEPVSTPHSALRIPHSSEPGRWLNGNLPPNVRLGTGTVLTADYAFKRFLSKQTDALVIGDNCTMDGVHFALGREARMVIGDFCYFTNAVLLCELEVRVGRSEEHTSELQSP